MKQLSLSGALAAGLLDAADTLPHCALCRGQSAAAHASSQYLAATPHDPVHWRIRTPAGRFELRALLDAQELDSRASTGTVYWEGLAELLAPDGARVGLGYLEMTGRAQPLTLGF